jgi:DNA-binding GntR family transcriptional regulator
MNTKAAAISDRIHRAIHSGKLKADGNYTIAALIAVLGVSRAELSNAVNRDFGSVAEFCSKIGFTGMKA